MAGGQNGDEQEDEEDPSSEEDEDVAQMKLNQSIIQEALQKARNHQVRLVSLFAPLADPNQTMFTWWRLRGMDNVHKCYVLAAVESINRRNDLRTIMDRPQDWTVLMVADTQLFRFTSYPTGFLYGCMPTNEWIISCSSLYYSDYFYG